MILTRLLQVWPHQGANPASFIMALLPALDELL